MPVESEESEGGSAVQLFGKHQNQGEANSAPGHGEGASATGKPPGQAAADPPAANVRKFPGPVVIGEMPSFPPVLGPLPGNAAAMTGDAVPDTALDGADLPGLTIRGGSLRGEDHRNQRTVRQDSMGLWRVSDGTTGAVLACVTDGVGSQPFSHRGAVAVCRLMRDLTQPVVSKLFRAEPKTGLPDFWDHLANLLSVQLIDQARRQEMEPITLSATLAAALIEESPAHPAERRYLILNVGDATAFVLRGGEFAECLDDPHQGVVTESRTWTLPTSIGPVGTASGVLAPGDVLMVCTDGMSNPMRNQGVRDQLAQWWGGGRIPDLPEFGWQLSYRVKSYGDDRTAVCVWAG